MSTPKNKKGTTNPWFQCEKCLVNILLKDIDNHSNDCPPDLENINYNFVKNKVLFSSIGIKNSEEIKGISPNDRDSMVFMSQSAIQLCNLSIGDWAIVKTRDVSRFPVAKIVWPTNVKLLSSVLFTKNCLDLSFEEPNVSVTVSAISESIFDANIVMVVCLNSSSIELTSELINRLNKTQLGKIFIRNNKISVLYYGRTLIFEIKHIETMGRANLEQTFDKLTINQLVLSRIVTKTQWKLYSSEVEKQIRTEDYLSKVGGLQEEIAEIKEIMEASLNYNTKMNSLKFTRSVLLYGHSGTGKSLLSNAVAKYSKVNVVTICAPDLYSKYSSNPEESIKEMFTDAINNSPSVVVLDEVDLLCPIRTSRITETEKRIVSTVLNVLDNLESNERVFIIATTNKIDNIDPAFRRYGRLDREIEIPTPNPFSRKDILKKLLCDVDHNLNDDQLKEISSISHGFVGADLVSVCSRATLQAAKNNRDIVQYEDFKFALTKVRPSAMRDVQIEVPNVRWSDIGGQDKLKLVLRQAVEWPFKYAESFVRLGITPPKGVLMFGPPGCSKTMIAKALATESGLNFISIKGPELFSKWVGESERAVREVFRKAKQVAPSVIFFDEIDALGAERTSGSSASVQERVLAQLLTELDGITPLGDVTVLAATNRPDRIDKALLRPGRLDRIVYVPLPDDTTRKEIFLLKLSRMSVLDVDVEELVHATKNYSGAEINAICHEAAMIALEDDLNAQHVEAKHFQKALQLISPRTPPSLINIYDNYINLKM